MTGDDVARRAAEHVAAHLADAIEDAVAELEAVGDRLIALPRWRPAPKAIRLAAFHVGHCAGSLQMALHQHDAWREAFGL